MNTKYLTIALVVIIVVAGALGYMAYNGTFSAKKPTLIVFAASSMINVIANMTQAFETANNCKIVVNSASSSTLYTQITSGSPCDVFMSANNKWIIASKQFKNLYIKTIMIISRRTAFA